MAVVAGVFVWAWRGGHTFDAKASDVCTGLLTYASISFGFAVSGLIMALAISNEAFARLLAKTKAEGHPLSTYSDLLFVYAWTAIIHVGLIVICLLSYAVYKPDEKFFVPSLTNFERGYSVLTGIVAAYAVMQFVITVLTLVGFGRVYIKLLLAKDKETE